MERKIRVLIAKTGLDGHDRGAKIIAMALRNAGMDVIYTGRRQTPEQIVNAAIEEDVDAIGLSSLSGAHETHFIRVLHLLKQCRSDEIPVFGGGIIPKEDAEKLKKQGVVEIFGPGSPLQEIVNKFHDEVMQKWKTTPC
jgi:methylmalonyl-CoA mutase C-terminal domain/subunit